MNETIVILVYLRDREAQQVKSINEFLDYYCSCSKEAILSIKEHIRSTGGSDIAIILDGYDELPENLLNDSSSFFN